MTDSCPINHGWSYRRSLKGQLPLFAKRHSLP